jgi:lysophospholipase L1-like esterase
MKRSLIALASVVVLALLSIYIPKVIHETVESRVPGQQYVVGLGDSVAAGAGLSGATNGPPGGCDVSSSAFPFVVAQQLHKPIEQLACSGATVAATGSTNNLSEQYKTAEPYITGSDVVVSAGANDIGWIQTLESCATTNCATTKNSTLLAGKLQTMQHNLTNVLVQIQQAHPHKLVVNTYYDLFQSGDTCFARLGITSQEVSFIHTEELQLNTAIAAASTAAKATLVAVDFSGHTLCSATPWIQNIAASAPLHPTIAGQQQIARQDAQALTASP